MSTPVVATGAPHEEASFKLSDADLLRRTEQKTRRRRMRAWIFMIPLIAVNVLVIVVPASEAVYYSFTNWTGYGAARFVGVANFETMLTSGQFWQALFHNVLWTIFFLIVPMAMGLAGAFMLSRITRFQSLFRALYFIPYILATVVSSVIWENLLNPNGGIGSAIGFLKNVSFFGNQHLALGSVAFVNNWQWWGFLVVMFLAAMQGTDPVLYEAARIDGASTWREFVHITLPSIRPVLMFLALMTIIWSFLVFDYIYIITQGGPNNATQVIGTLMYTEAFSNQAAGYASAMGLFLGVISIVVVLIYTRLRRRGWNV
ncbi:MAG TPA: sugar ABC transporter permease [Streptosporangiaceae bacterium]|nr:sugar ABC transporter permease [Streptosporangiaceae bacterium]